MGGLQGTISWVISHRALGYPMEAHHAGLYFIGFNNYALGGILGTIFTETHAVLKHLQSMTM